MQNYFLIEYFDNLPSFLLQMFHHYKNIIKKYLDLSDCILYKLFPMLASSNQNIFWDILKMNEL